MPKMSHLLRSDEGGTTVGLTGGDNPLVRSLWTFTTCDLFNIRPG